MVYLGVADGKIPACSRGRHVPAVFSSSGFVGHQITGQGLSDLCKEGTMAGVWAWSITDRSRNVIGRAQLASTRPEVDAALRVVVDG
jgi:hypothetical protein